MVDSINKSCFSPAVETFTSLGQSRVALKSAAPNACAVLTVVNDCLNTLTDGFSDNCAIPAIKNGYRLAKGSVCFAVGCVSSNLADRMRKSWTDPFSTEYVLEKAKKIGAKADEMSLSKPKTSGKEFVAGLDKRALLSAQSTGVVNRHLKPFFLRGVKQLYLLVERVSNTAASVKSPLIRNLNEGVVSGARDVYSYVNTAMAGLAQTVQPFLKQAVPLGESLILAKEHLETSSLGESTKQALSLLGRSWAPLYTCGTAIKKYILKTILLFIRIIDKALGYLTLNPERRLLKCLSEKVQDKLNQIWKRVTEKWHRVAEEQEASIRKDVVVYLTDVGLDFTVKTVSSVAVKSYLGYLAYMPVRSLLTTVLPVSPYLVDVAVGAAVVTSLWKNTIKPTLQPWHENYSKEFDGKGMSLKSFCHRMGISDSYYKIKILQKYLHS